jgi:predicted DNA-binding transcriptional regulator AlpA
MSKKARSRLLSSKTRDDVAELPKAQPNRRPTHRRVRITDRGDDDDEDDVVALLPVGRELPRLGENSRLLGKRELCEKLDRTFQCLHKWIAQGRFPAPRDFLGRPAWLESDINRWIAELPLRRYRRRT